MNAGYADVPNPLYLVAHGFCGQGCFLRNRNIAGTGGYNSYDAHPSFSSISLNSYQTCSAVPLGIGRDISNFAESSFVCVSDQNIGRALDQSIDDTHNLPA